MSTVDSRTADIVTDLLRVELDKLRSARNRPYFGNVNYASGAEGNVRTIYIGEFNVDNRDPRYVIVSRNAPIAKLYYVPTSNFYDSPAGP